MAKFYCHYFIIKITNLPTLASPCLTIPQNSIRLQYSSRISTFIKFTTFKLNYGGGNKDNGYK